MTQPAAAATERAPSRSSPMLPGAAAERICWAVLAAIFAGAGVLMRFAMNPDGISYLDIASDYVRGDWRSAVTAHWNPFYAWLVAALFGITGQSPATEFQRVQVLNTLIALAAIPMFAFYFRALRTRMGAGSPTWELTLLGYCVLAANTLSFQTVGLVNPDATVTLLQLLFAAMLLRGASNGGVRTHLGIGAIFGILCLAKVANLAVCLPAIAAFVASSTRRTRDPRLPLAAAAGFLVLFGPWVAALTWKYGEWTVSGSQPILPSVGQRARRSTRRL